MHHLDTRRTRRLLAGTPWPAAAQRLASGLRRGGHRPGQLLVVGPTGSEPWHLVAHLGESAAATGEELLRPTWVRRNPEPSAAPHLRHGRERLEQAGRGSTILMVAPAPADDDLMNLVSDSRSRGSVVFGLAAADRRVEDVSDDAVLTGQAELGDGTLFEAMQHLVSLAPLLPRRRWAA